MTIFIKGKLLKTQMLKQDNCNMNINYRQQSQNASSQFYNPWQELFEKKPKQINIKKQKTPKNVENSSSQNSTINQNFYKVDTIKGRRYRGGKLQYLVSWVGYQGQDTWQNMNNLKHLSKLICQFQTQLKRAELQQASRYFTIKQQYQYDFSFRGNNLVIIQAEDQTFPKFIHLQTKTTEKMDVQNESSKKNDKQTMQAQQKTQLQPLDRQSIISQQIISAAESNSYQSSLAAFDSYNLAESQRNVNVYRQSNRSDQKHLTVSNVSNNSRKTITLKPVSISILYPIVKKPNCPNVQKTNNQVENSRKTFRPCSDIQFLKSNKVNNSIF